MKKHRRITNRRGVTLVEVMVASSIAALATLGAAMTLLAGMSSWVQGQGKIDAETDSQGAVRLISQNLREAMAVTVDANGRGLTFRLPTKDGSGNYIVPAVWDGVTRRLELSGTDINLVSAGTSRTLCRNIILTDPLSTGGTTEYRPFTAGAGTMTRQVTIQIVKQTTGNLNRVIKSRRRETIYLRNIPELRN